MNTKQNDSALLQKVKPSKVFIPIFIGLIVVGYLFYKEFNPEAFSQIEFGLHALLWLCVAVLLMLLRDVGYVIRLMILSQGELTLKQAIRIIFLWEFTSAVTPSAIGGTSIALLFLYKEGLNAGKSTAIVLATSFLDELYFITMFPLLFVIVQPAALFSIGGAVETVSFANEFFYFATVGYSLKFVFTLFVAYGLFFNPQAIKAFISKVFTLRFIKRWRDKGTAVGDELIVASRELKTRGMFFWVKAFAASFLSWTSRYWVVNCLFLAFFAVNDHFLIFSRQLVMWIMMLVSPTPGGSGFAEYVFNEYLGEFIPILGLAIPLAFLWRVVSYYLYLLIGVVILPRWIKARF